MTLAPAPWRSPVAEIERAVQDRAATAAIDMNAAGSHDRLRALLEEEVARWRDEFQRGRRPIDIADPDRAIERALRNLTGYGPLEALLDDPDVWEIMINSPDTIFCRRHRGPSGYHDEVFHDDDHVVRILTKILDEASGSHRKLDPAEGLQDAQLSTGARLHIVHADIAREGHVLVNIRKFTGVPYKSLGQLVARDMLDAPTATSGAWTWWSRSARRSRKWLRAQAGCVLRRDAWVSRTPRRGAGCGVSASGRSGWA